MKKEVDRFYRPVGGACQAPIPNVNGYGPDEACCRPKGHEGNHYRHTLDTDPIEEVIT